MAGFNKVLMMGNLTRDPQLSYTPNQTAVVDFGLATNRKWTAQDGGQREETCFVDCRAFGKLAENINKYMSKGRPIFIEGRLTFDTWTAQDGTKRSKHRVTVENFQFLPSASGASHESGNAAGGRSVSADSPGQQSGPANECRTAGGAVGDAAPNDDIPF